MEKYVFHGLNFAPVLFINFALQVFTFSMDKSNVSGCKSQRVLKTWVKGDIQIILF